MLNMFKKVFVLFLCVFIFTLENSYALRLFDPEIDGKPAVEESVTEDDNIIDTSIVDKLNGVKVQELSLDFGLKSFNSCENLEDVMGKYIKDYYSANQDRYNRNIMFK
jgi:hypothetical protein